MEEKKLKLYKLAKYTNLEIVMEAQMQSTGANQAKLMERYKKNKKSVQHQVLTLKIVYAVLIFFTGVVPIFTILQLVQGLSFGTLPLDTALFGGTLFFGIFFITQFIYLLLLGMFNISAMMTGEAFKWYETLPISKRRLQKLGLVTVIRNLDIVIITMIISFPIIIAIMTQNVLLVIITCFLSVLNVVFVVSLLVLIAERMSRVFKGDQVNSKKATVLRIFTMLSYFIVAMSASLIIQWAMNTIDDIFAMLATITIPDIVNFIFGLIPFPFAPANILTLFIDPAKFAPSMWISGLIGIGLLILLTLFLYKKALSSMRTVTITSAAEKKIKTVKRKKEDIVVDIQVRSPIQAYRKKDLSASTRDMQTLMYLILPMILPFVYSIIFTIVLGSSTSLDIEDVLIFWSILMFYQPMISIIITTGFLNMEDGGASILAGLPILPRDQAKAKLSLLIIIQTISFFVPVFFFITTPVFIDYLLLFIAWYPVTLVFLFTIFYLKIRLFGRMKYKFVLEEVNPKKKTIKWILMVATEGLIYIFYVIFGSILILVFGLIPMVLIVSITSVLILVGLLISVNWMFPKKLGKRIMTSIRHALRQKPLLGTFVVLLVYFAFLYLSANLAIILILPLYSILPLAVALYIEFLYNFGFMMLLWLLVVPRSLRLPIGKSNFKEYLRSVKLISPLVYKESKFVMNIILGLSCVAIYYSSALIFGNILGNYVFDPSIVFGPPRIVSGGIIFGWSIFFIMLIPGIWEEWGFRGVLIPLNSKKYSKLTVLIITSVVFGIYHLVNILFGQDWIYTLFQALFATAFGFLFGYIFIKTNSLLPSIIMHYLVNSLGQLFVNTVPYNELSAALYLIFGVGVVPAILGMTLVYIITKFAFPKLYQD